MTPEFSSSFLSVLVLPLGALLLSVLGGKLALLLFPKWGMLDNPTKYGHKRAPIPYPGGILIPVTCLFMVAAFFPWTPQIQGLLIGGTVIALISFLDDRFDISAIFRLLTQIGVATLIIVTGTKIEFLSDPFGSTAFELTSLLSFIITLIWIIAVMNTVNWLDGIPGVAAGTSTLAGVFLGLLSLSSIVDQPELATMCFIFAAANLGFLFWNISPPKMLNGDSGAIFSGFMIGALSIFSGGKMATAFLVLALPIFDAGAVIFHRLREKKSPLHGKDQKHFHDQLLKKGFSERQVMSLFLVTAFTLGISTFFVQTLGKLILLILAGSIVFYLSWQQESHKKKQL